jgi:hypothetical protein
MRQSLNSIRTALVCWALLFVSLRSQAVVLDWSNITWTPGSLSNSYDIDASNPGNDITITISGSGTNQFFSSTYPKVTQDFTGGISPAPDQLDLYVDFANTSQSITITVSFLYSEGVSNVNFTLFDVDTGDTFTEKGKTKRTFVDQVDSIYATATNGTLIAPTIVNSNASFNTVSGSGTNQTVVGTTKANDFSNEGSVGVSYGTNTISSFTFTYGEGPNTGNDPAAQGIGLYDISFSPKPKVPEFHPAWVSAALCFLVVALQLPRFLRRDPLINT